MVRDDWAPPTVAQRRAMVLEAIAARHARQEKARRDLISTAVLAAVTVLAWVLTEVLR